MSRLYAIAEVINHLQNLSVEVEVKKFDEQTAKAYETLQALQNSLRDITSRWVEDIISRLMDTKSQPDITTPSLSTKRDLHAAFNIEFREALRLNNQCQEDIELSAAIEKTLTQAKQIFTDYLENFTEVVTEYRRDPHLSLDIIASCADAVG